MEELVTVVVVDRVVSPCVAVHKFRVLVEVSLQLTRAFYLAYLLVVLRFLRSVLLQGVSVGKEGGREGFRLTHAFL